MSTNKKHHYTVEYALKFDDANPSSVLDKLEKIAICIYNDVLGESLKRLHRVQHDKDYLNALEQLSILNKKSSLTRTEQTDRKHQYDIIQKVCNTYGYTENDLHAYVANTKHYFHDALGIHECQKLASRAFHATENVRFRKTMKVDFKNPKKDLIAIENKSNDTGIRYNYKSNCIKYKNYLFHIVIKKNDEYAQQALLDKVKFVRLVPRNIRGKRRWYAQLVFEGTPSQKNKNTSHISDKVCVSFKGDTVVINTEQDTKIIEIETECKKEEQNLRRIQRKMERSKKSMNPNNYNDDGSVKKKTKKWNYSNNYKKLEIQKNESYRKLTAKRKMAHEKLAIEIINKGSNIYIEKLGYEELKQKEQQETTNRKTTYSNKKYPGRALNNRAPLKLIQIIEQKLAYKDRTINYIHF